MSKFFDFDSDEVKKQKKRKQMAKTGEITTSDVVSASDSLSIYEKMLEHMCGVYDCINLISKHMNVGAQIKMEDNAIYLDRLSSVDFYMHDGFVEKFEFIDRSGKPIKKENKANPFVVCKYDFFYQIDWTQVYIYKDRMYFVAAPKSINSVSYRNFKYFTLSIFCDVASKMDIFKGYSHIDLRKIKLDVEEDEDENGNEIQHITPRWEQNYVEKSIPLMILNDENQHLIKRYSEAEFQEERQKYLDFIANKDIDSAIGKYNVQYASLNQFFNVETKNTQQRDYKSEEDDFEKKKDELFARLGEDY